MKRQNIRTLSLIVCTFTYLLVGAAVFDALESDHEVQQRGFVVEMRDKLRKKYNISETDYDMLEAVIVKSIPHKAGHQWKFSGAFYFAMTVITTIGYGHSTPTTIGGKIFCMFYALAGIPLGLVMFQSIGERINTFAAMLMRCYRRSMNKPANVTHIDLILVTFGGGSFIIATGAYVFHSYEKWSYFDSIYYCFTTLTTIGFGDFVALQTDNALQGTPEYVLFSLIFIVVGLTMVSASINLLVLKFFTLNTEDEKRDEQEAQLAARGLVRVNQLNKPVHSSELLYPSRFYSLSRDTTLDTEPDRKYYSFDGENISVSSCTCMTDTGLRKRLPPRGQFLNSSIHLVPSDVSSFR